MLSFHIITVSQQPAGPWRELVQEYTKRISSQAKITLTQVKPEKIVAGIPRDQILTKEGERILQAVAAGSLLVVCDEFGKNFTSRLFAEQLNNWSEQHTRTITLVLGGPLGLSQAVKSAADGSLALAKWTLPHDLALVVLLEQLYRALTIHIGKTYHY